MPSQPSTPDRAFTGLLLGLGATRSQICAQFFTESLLLSALAGVGGAVLGLVVTTCYAVSQHWPTVVPSWVLGGGLLTTWADTIRWTRAEAVLTVGS